MTITQQKYGHVTLIRINRADVRNAVDATTAEALYEAFLDFDSDPEAHVAVLAAQGEHFCAGADLKAVAEGRGNPLHDVSVSSLGPMGPSRLQLSKPVISAIEGYAVAGGLELALWSDMRVVSETAVFGVFCRRFGVPLIDGGTFRLARLIGESRAMDLVLTGRSVDAAEAYAIGLANRLVPAGEAEAQAIQIAKDIAKLPQVCLRGDRSAVRMQWGLSEAEALAQEWQHGLHTISSGETHQGVHRFVRGDGTHTHVDA